MGRIEEEVGEDASGLAVVEGILARMVVIARTLLVAVSVVSIFAVGS